MSDIIKLLPDSVANQIAAGEVIQRPASIIKELVENAVDAGSSVITVHVKDAGRTLVQVVDNGKGMSPTDARMSFERHATSKITRAEDIFHIRTKGFRGEALASVAAVAQVELRTCPHGDELGTLLCINGSKVEKQEPVRCASGSNFMVKNLFYNIPVRREFLKTDNHEFGLILDEFQRVALAHPDIQFVLFHNDKEIYNLTSSNVLKRILLLFGKQLEKTLIPVETRTSLVSIRGFVSKPESARKKSGDQFLMVNNRFIRHKSFYAAIMRAYENLLPERWQPQYFLFFDIDPAEIDVNIHPTKTEVKFKNDSQIVSFLEAAVKESLGKFNVKPSLDFDDDTDYNDMFRLPNDSGHLPSFQVDGGFNPFNANKPQSQSANSFSRKQEIPGNRENWENLYANFETQLPDIQPVQQSLDLDVEKRSITSAAFMQFRSRYIVTPMKSGLMMIDQRRAHERILYEKYIDTMQMDVRPIQHVLHPHLFEVNPADFDILCDSLDELRTLGFDIEVFGKNTFAINGIPSDIKPSDIETKLNDVLATLQELRCNSKLDVREGIARSMAKLNAIPQQMPLSVSEMQELTSDLFLCRMPNFTPDGKKVVYILENDEIALKFS